MEAWRTDWMSKKRDVALRLAAGECGGSYGEAVIVLCTAISAIAADVWPGRRKDRVRFVELLKEFAPPSLHLVRISVPLLVGLLRQQARTSEMLSLEKTLLGFSHSQVLTGDDVDKPEVDVLRVCPSLKTPEIRECCYANLLYEEIRSGYAHEYRPGTRADSWSMTSVRTAPVSYVNWVNDPERHIHFHVEWIAQVALAVAEAVDAIGKTLPRTDPVRWWLQG